MKGTTQLLQKLPLSGRCWFASRSLPFVTPKISLPSIGASRPPTIPPLQVPTEISRPSYVANHGLPPPLQRYPVEEVKTAEAIARMRDTGALAAAGLQMALDATKPGVTGLDVECMVHDFFVAQQAYPSPLGFHNYPRSLLVSINEAVCHGIPNDRPFEPGDLIKYDCIVYANGVHGDCAASIVVEDTAAAPEKKKFSQQHKLVKACLEARNEAIKICGPGVPFMRIAEVVEKIASKYGYAIISDFSGHFIGEELHMLPLIPHVTANQSKTYGTLPAMAPGQTFTIEPIFVENNPQIGLLDDGWTVVTSDGGNGAQWEHTILITDDGAEILTPLRNEQRISRCC